MPKWPRITVWTAAAESSDARFFEFSRRLSAVGFEGLKRIALLGALYAAGQYSMLAMIAYNVGLFLFALPIIALGDKYDLRLKPAASHQEHEEAVRTKHHRALSLALTAATTLAFMIAINIGVQLGVQALTREIGDAARKGSDPPARTSPAAPRTGRPVAKPTA